MKKRSKKRWLRKYDGKKYGWFLTVRDFALTLLAVFLLFSLFVGVSRVNGNSMNPTLENGDVVFFFRVSRDFTRGDVVFARMPSGSNYVKRIVAVEGDVVDVRDGVLYINGEREPAGNYLLPTEADDGIVTYPYLVGPDMYFLVGDNRPGSQDSRHFGALPQSSIRGRLLLVR